MNRFRGKGQFLLRICSKMKIQQRLQSFFLEMWWKIQSFERMVRNLLIKWLCMHPKHNSLKVTFTDCSSRCLKTCIFDRKRSNWSSTSPNKMTLNNSLQTILEKSSKQMKWSNKSLKCSQTVHITVSSSKRQLNGFQSSLWGLWMSRKLPREWGKFSSQDH